MRDVAPVIPFIFHFRLFKNFGGKKKYSINMMFCCHLCDFIFLNETIHCLVLLYILHTEKENLCLYGLPNETWEVNLPVEEVPPELPEPALGINFARDGMQEKDWLSLVAVHSDSWLLAVAFYFGARFGFGKNERYDDKYNMRIFIFPLEIFTLQVATVN